MNSSSVDNSSAFMGFQYPYEKSKVAILQMPYEGTSTYIKGQAKAPKAIIDASQQVETYDIELEKDFIDEIGFHTLPPLKCGNLGPEEAIDLLQKETSKILKNNKFPIIFGGEHSISLGAVKAAKEKFEDLCVLQIDAHADMRDEYENSKFNHACVMSRVREIAPVVSVGIRSYCIEEAELIKNKYFDAIFGPKLNEEVINKIISKIKSKYVYITIDVDGFDPSIMPAVGTPEPGGLGWHETLSLLRKVCSKKNVIGADIVELAPIEGQIYSDFTCAKLAYKLAGYCLI
ncbi:MAG: agmatinase [Candidatus Micrarchaeota archaeon]